MKREIIKTRDSSHTIAIKELNEHYHSTNGAINESEHVFIRHGFHVAGQWLNPLNILEIGFGTGLNALLTYREHLKEKRKINYVAVEPFPLNSEEINTLNYPEIINFDNSYTVFIKLHKNTDTPYFVGDRFIVLHLKEKIETISLKQESFNVVYFDAFAPSVQSEIWSAKIFKKIFDAMERNGILVTYSASGDVKRTLKDVGFSLKHPAGPEGKREITVAQKSLSWDEILEA